METSRMSMMGSTELASVTPAATVQSDAERDNCVRYRRGGGGHVESHFIKANSPDGARALWIKHTLLVPEGSPEAASAEVWAVAFAGGGARKVAEKRSFRLGEAAISAAPFAIRTPCATLSHGVLEGRLDTIAWDLRYACPEQAFRPFPLSAMYTASFPRSKSLTPAPDTRLSGSFSAWGERWSVDGWRAAQGHNWGASHAYAYAWSHCNAWEDDRGEPLDGAWFEALTGRVRVARALISPWLSVAAIAIDGRLTRFDGPRALFSRSVAIDTRSYTLELHTSEATLTAHFAAEAEQFAGLRYEDPDGRALSCLNAKLARGTLELRRAGRTVRLRTSQAALELGTRRPGHGIPTLV
jgi:hypothetical protein